MDRILPQLSRSSAGFLSLGLALACACAPVNSTAFAEGERWLKEGEPWRAIERFHAAKREGADFATLYYKRGLAYAMAGEFDSALEDYDRAIARDPRHAWSRAMRSDELVRKGLHDNALADIDRAVGSSPGEPEFLRRRASLLRRQKRLSEAGRDLDRALRTDPQHAPSLVLRGEVFLEEGRAGRAVACLDSASLAAPSDPSVYNSRGLARLACGETRAAEADFDRALQLSPRFAEARLNLGVAVLRESRFAEAESHLTRALFIRPDWASALLRRGETRLGLGDLEGALADFNRLAILDPSHAENLFLRGLARERAMRLPEARSDLEKSVRLAPRAAAWAALGRTLAALGRTREAGEAFDEAVRLDGDDAHIRLDRGEFLLDSLQASDALEDLNLALLFDESAPRAHELLGRARFLRGEWSEAVASFDRELARGVPPSRRLLAERGLSLSRLGRHAEAVRDLERVSGDHVSDTSFLFDFGASLLGDSRHDRALVVSERLLQLGEFTPATHFFRGRVFAGMNRWAEAIASFTEALQLDPGHIAALEARGHASFAAGDYAAAARDLKVVEAARAPR